MSDYPKVSFGNEEEERFSIRREFRTAQHRRQITIDDVRARKAFEIGEGNLSEGIRRCIDLYEKKPDVSEKIE